MKTRKMFAVILALLLFIMMMAGCANTSETLYDNGVTNEEVYQNYDNWGKENEIRLITDIKVNQEDLDVEGEISEVENLELPKSKEKVVQKLREGIISFFQERYQIDVSEKLEKQEVAMFSSIGTQEGVMGYVDVNNPNILNLNQKLLKEYSELFETTYIHETLHQIGFRSDNTLIIEEGITDALTDMICCYIGIKTVLTPYYFECRTLAYQLLAADPEIVSCYLENDEFDIIGRINEKLESVPQTYRKTSDLGKRLERMVNILYGISTGTVWGYSTDTYWFAFEAQEIVKAYCQACEPDSSIIDYIHSHYLPDAYESVTIFEDENGYGYYFE